MRVSNLGKGKGFSFNQVVILLLVIGGIGYFAFKFSGTPSPQTITTEPTSQVTRGDCESQQCFQNPTYTYSAVDKFTSTAMTGTDQIKVNGKAPVSSLANPQKCSKLEYWLSNTSHFVQPKVESEVKCGANQIEADGYQNASVTLSAYDQYTVIATATHNVTLGANGIVNIDFTWQGTAKRANMPFGGCMVVEYPATISDVTPSGEGLSTASCRFIKTYSVSSTSNTYRSYDVPAGWDADGSGAKKNFAMQVRASASNPSGNMIVTFYPANYYVSNDGNFVLGVEKDKNQDTSAVYSSAVSKTINVA